MSTKLIPVPCLDITKPIELWNPGKLSFKLEGYHLYCEDGERNPLGFMLKEVGPGGQTPLAIGPPVGVPTPVLFGEGYRAQKPGNRLFVQYLTALLEEPRKIPIMLWGVIFGSEV